MVLRGLQRKAIEYGLPLAEELVYALCAREEVTNVPADRDMIVVTAADIFVTVGETPRGRLVTVVRGPASGDG